MRYAIIKRRDWDGLQDVVESPGRVLIHASRLNSTVENMTQRSYVLSYPSVSRRLRDSKRVYIAGAYGGIVIEPIPLP